MQQRGRSEQLYGEIETKNKLNKRVKKAAEGEERGEEIDTVESKKYNNAKMRTKAMDKLTTLL